MENSRKRIRDVRRHSGDGESLGYGFRSHNSADEDRTPANGRLQDLLCAVKDESEKFRNRPTKQMKSTDTGQGIKLKGQNATVEVCGSIYTNEPNKKRVTEANQEQQKYDDFRVSNPSSLVGFECSEGPRLEQFEVGDVVWVKSKRRKDRPVWPAEVIHLVKDAPESMQSVCVPGRLCVKFLHIKNNLDCAYKWVKEKRVFPFWDFRTLKYKSRKFLKSSSKDLKDEFSEAIDEATKADFWSGYRVMQDQEEETTCSSCNEKFPASGLLPSVQVKQRSTSSAKVFLICRPCYKLYKFNQYCGISMKVRTPTFKTGWLQCQKCNVWVHYNCDNISSEQLENLDEYSCPQCTPKQPALGTSLKEKNNKSFSVPEHLTVICNGKEANYVTNSHLILCECNECEKGKSMSLSQWEKHVGSKMKKWKQSVRLSGSNQHLIDWLNKACEAGVRGLGFFPQEGQTPFSNRERELRGWLLEPYEPIQETWIPERCAICRRDEDWHYNKFIICNGCNIGVHENCYGASESGEDWICTACQSLKTDTTPQRCCLCPVMGGALKPTTTSGFWVHVTCACFTNEVTFVNDKTMEPVDGILKINPDSFRKSCIVCNKMQGSCVKCMECATFYHPTCALIEGYHMELSYWNKKGKDVCTYISYCASHRVPDPNVGVRIPDLNSILMGIQKEAAAVTHSEGSSDESSSSKDGNNLEEVGLCKIEEPYASRTSVHNRLKAKSGISSIIHEPVGYSHHSREAINKRLKTEREADPPQFSSYRDRLSYCQKNEKNRFRFGKSGVHGYGLFTIEPIRRGEMVIEYRGEIIRNNVANVREKRYQSEGKQSTYLFAIDKETVIDATKKGNAARMINHSCAPNCFSRVLPVGVESRIALFAKKDIEAGEEITCDYRLSKEGIKERCVCGAATCRKVMQEF